MLDREPIRLVIWDLDETFWRGTLSEGGIQEYIQDHHHIVIELAKRGIISSICSKNDYAMVQKILQEQGIWDYFILPSIDWTPKGSRLKALIEDLQLRPESILFIDDNAGNRAEAASMIPGLQVEDETIIKKLLQHELCTGKDDRQLSRLKQYQLLQRRKTDAKTMGADNKAFLRASNIRVTILTDVNTNIDRAVELIRRTNQLNFTKLHISDDDEKARKSLLTLANRYYNQAGLIHVQDNYGDYGLCGFYILHRMKPNNWLMHFCFSCRILGMDIEKWLYQKLETPAINIKGDKALQLITDEPIDWINTHVNGALQFIEKINCTTNTPYEKIGIPEIRLHGGCELEALSHYLMQETENIISKTNYINGIFLARMNCMTNLSLSLLPNNPTLKDELIALGYKPDDFERSFLDAPSPNTLFVISNWGDLFLPVYKHKTLGFDISIELIKNYNPDIWLYDLTQATPDLIQKYTEFYECSAVQRSHLENIVHHLTAHYTYTGLISDAILYKNWLTILNTIPKHAWIAILLPTCNRGEAHATSQALHYHALTREIARQFPNVILIDVTQYIQRPEDTQEHIDHLDRMIYFNIYKDLTAKLKKKMAHKQGQNDTITA